MLLKNYDLKPTCSTIVPEAHVGCNKSFRHFKDGKRRQGHNFQKGDDRFDPNNRNNPRQ